MYYPTEVNSTVIGAQSERGRDLGGVNYFNQEHVETPFYGEIVASYRTEK